MNPEEYNRYMEQSRRSWVLAGDFPLDKCAVYPEHAAVFDYDSIGYCNILDYGSGPGADASQYLKRCNTVTLVDIVPENLQKAEQNLKSLGLNDKATFVLIEQSHVIPLPDETYDIINSNGVLHHIREPLPVIQTLHRLIKSDGLFYCMLYTKHHELVLQPVIQQFQAQGLSYEEASGRATDGKDIPYTKFYSEQEGIELLRSAGFKVNDIRLYHQNLFAVYVSEKL